MSLIKKSDVKNHLSTRTGASVLPIRQTSHSDATGYSEDDHSDATPKTASAPPVEISRAAEAAAPAAEVRKPEA